MDDDKTEFGTAELWAPEPRLGAAWAGVTLADEPRAEEARRESPREGRRSPRFECRGAGRSVAETPVGDGAVASGVREERAPFEDATDRRAMADRTRDAAVSSRAEGRRWAGLVLVAVVGALIGIGAAQFAREWFGRGAKGAPPSVAPLAAPPEAAPSAAVPPESPPPESLPSETVPPGSPAWSSKSARRVLEALLAGRCSEAKVALASASAPELGRFARIAHRVCRGGAP